MTLYHVAAIGIVAAAILLLVCILRKRPYVRMGLLGFWLIFSDQQEQKAKERTNAPKKERKPSTKKQSQAPEEKKSDLAPTDVSEGVGDAPKKARKTRTSNKSTKPPGEAPVPEPPAPDKSEGG